MTRKILSSLALSFSLQIGYDDNGKPIVQKKSFSNIYPNVAEEDLIAISNAFKKVLKGSVINTGITEFYRLTDN